VCALLPQTLGVFENAEFGLGVQLLRPDGGGDSPCWGHEACGFALVVPGRRPLVAALLHNRPTSPHEPGGMEKDTAARVKRALMALAGTGQPVSQ